MRFLPVDYCATCEKFFVTVLTAPAARCAVLHPPGSCCHFRQREVPRERWFAQLAKTIAVDFDGVIHPYTKGWIGSIPDDEPPIPGAVEFIDRLRRDDFRVVVFSTRCDHDEGLRGVVEWLRHYGIEVDDVTCQKPAAVAYVDDRAVPFVGNWDDVMSGIEVLLDGPAHGAARGA